MAPDRGGEGEAEASVGDDRTDRDDTAGPTDLADADTDALLARLHDELAATAERPVEPGAARWLGEAEAVAADVADGDAPRAAVETRLRQLRELLSHVESTGDDEADAHLAAARDLLDALEARR